MSQHYDEKTKKWYYTGKYRDLLGNRHDYKKRGFRTKKEAKAAEELFLQKIKGGYGRIRFDALTALYNEEMKKTLKASTLVGYEVVQRHYMAPYFKDRFIDSITTLDVSRWSEYCAGLKKDNGEPRCGPGYIKNQFLILVAMFEFAVDHDLIKKNPCNGTTWYQDPNALPEEEPSKDNYWEVEEYKTFIKTVEDLNHKEIYETLFCTGLREGELVALTWNDVDFENKKIKISRTWSSSTLKFTSPKSKNSVRCIDIPARLVDMLKQRYARCKKIDGFSKKYYIFGDVELTPTWKLRSWLETDIQTAGAKRITPHGLRHSHASYLLSNPLVSEALVAERMGHGVETLRKTYAHIYEKHRNTMVDLLEIL